MNKKCITTVFTFLFFYVTVALVYAKSGHMYHKNLITFSSYMVNSNPRIPFVTQDSPFVNESPVL